MRLIQKIKAGLGKQSVTHNAAIWCNGIMNAYTTNDAFFRDELSWAETSTNWNRFMVISTLGMIHLGNRSKADEILGPYFAGAG